MVLILFCGIRREEAVKVTWDDIDFLNEKIKVLIEGAKKKKRRVNKAEPNVWNWLRYLKHKGANLDGYKAKGEKTTVSLRPERALIDPETKMDNNHKGKIEEVIYHGDHTRLRVDLLGNKEFILKVPNSSNRMDIKEGKEINIGWNSTDCRALDPK